MEQQSIIDWSKSCEDKKHADVYFDFSKASNGVPIDRLLLKI